MKSITRLVTGSFNISLPPSETLEDIKLKTGWLWSQDPFNIVNIDQVLTSLGRLGRGAIGEVDEVRSIAGKKTLARKRIAISRRQSLARREVELIQDEIANLRCLDHPHIVKLIGSYQQDPGTWKHSFCLLMYPVGNNDLSGFLEDDCKCVSTDSDSELSIRHSAWIMKWFTCLASALQYMHNHHLHHEDIKPKNIIHEGEHIYFTDFSSSRQFEAGQATSTANPARASRLFAAPEALPTEEGDLFRHGSKTDVFSLGLVFVEMLTILEGHTIDALHGYLERNNGFGKTYMTRQYHRVVDLMDGWFISDLGREMYTECIKPMLRQDRASRPSADEVVQLIRTRQPWGKTLACPCKLGFEISSTRAQRSSILPHHYT